MSEKSRHQILFFYSLSVVVAGGTRSANQINLLIGSWGYVKPNHVWPSGEQVAQPNAVTSSRLMHSCFIIFYNFQPNVIRHVSTLHSCCPPPLPTLGFQVPFPQPGSRWKQGICFYLQSVRCCTLLGCYRSFRRYSRWLGLAWTRSMYTSDCCHSLSLSLGCLSRLVKKNKWLAETLRA